MKALKGVIRITSLFCLLLTLVLIKNIKAQPALWDNFDPFHNSGRDVVIEGDFLWIGKSEGGVVKFNMNTGENKYFKRYYTPLISNTISRVIIDNSGNKWFGLGTFGNTESNGLVKYDDYSWLVFNSSNSILPDENISYFDADIYDNLWVGTASDGLLKYDGVSWIKYDTLNSGIPSNSVKHVAADNLGNVWFFTPYDIYKNSLVKFNGISWEIFYPDSNGFPGSIYTQIIIDKNNVKWMLSFHGLVKYDDNEFKIYNPGLNIIYATSMAVDSRGNCFIGTGLSGLVKFDTSGIWSSYTIGDSADPQSVRGIAIDNNDDKWLTTFKGLTRFSDKELESYPLSNAPLIDLRVGDVFIEENETIWIGTWGITKYDGVNWVRYDYKNSVFPFAAATKIQKDYDNNIWIGTYEGLVKLKDTSLTLFLTDNSDLPDNYITDIAVDANNFVWVTTGNGIARIKNDTISVFNSNNTAIIGRLITTVEVDRDNNKWFGGDSCGLVKYDDSDWAVFNTSNSFLKRNRIEDICIDINHNIWLALIEIQKFDGHNWYLYRPSDHLPVSDYILELEADSVGNIWTSSYQWGIIKFNRSDNWSLYNNQNSGLIGANQMVHSTRIDKNGYKYFATNDGGVSVYKGDLILSAGNIKDKFGPGSFLLYQNYPNPFNPKTNINYFLKESANVRLIIYDILGNEVQTLVNTFQTQGEYSVEFNAVSLSSGIYFYSLISDVFKQTKKLILLK